MTGVFTESIAAKEERHAKLIGCPHCAAGCLEPCRSTHGKVIEKTHVKRYRAWRGRRRALVAAIAVAESFGWKQIPEPNTDYRMRLHGGTGAPENVPPSRPEAYVGYDEGRVRIIKVNVLKEPGGGFMFWFYRLDKPADERGTTDALTAYVEAVGGPWARTFEPL